MPKNVRNFWLEADIDGRKTKLVGGPQPKNGGMYIELFVRHKGEVRPLCSIHCYNEANYSNGDPNKNIVLISFKDKNDKVYDFSLYFERD